MTVPLVTFLIALASYRLWRFIGVDTFPPIQKPRDWLFAKTKDKAGWVADLVECPWCLGSWVTALVTWFVSSQVSVPQPVLVGVAASALVGFIAQYDES